RVWDPMKPGTPPAILPGPGGNGEGTFGVTFLADDRLASAGPDRVVRLWHRKGAWTADRGLKHDSPLIALAVSPDGTTLVASTKDPHPQVLRWDLSRPDAPPETLATGVLVRGLALTPDGNVLIANAVSKLLVWPDWQRKPNDYRTLT